MASHKVTQVIQHLAAHEWCGHGSSYGRNLFVPCGDIQEKMFSALYRYTWRLGGPDATFWGVLLTMAMPQKTWCGQGPCLCQSQAPPPESPNLPIHILLSFPLKIKIHFYPAPAQEGENGRWGKFFCLAPAPKLPFHPWIPTMSQA